MPALRVLGLVVYLNVAWPLYPKLEEYSQAENVAYPATLALLVLLIAGVAFWLGARLIGRRKTYTRATLAMGPIIVGLIIAVLAFTGRQ